MTRRTRDPWLDNAKMALVVLVVVGHSWDLLPLEGLDRHLKDFLYVWHMPAFILITGYLSRNFTYTPQRIWQLVRTVAVPYVVFEGLLALFRVYVGGEHLETLFLDPHWPMWFLAALFFWRLLTPVLKDIPAAVVVAVTISVLSGFVTSEWFCVLRILGFLPFFVIGLKATPERLEWLRGTTPRILAVVSFAGIWLLSTYTNTWASSEWLYYRSPYSLFDVGDVRAFATRLVVLALGFVGALAFLALVPRRDGWFARMGKYTLVVYLCHGFVVKAAEYLSYPEWTYQHPVLSLLTTTAGAVAVALALASPPIARRLEVLVDPLGNAEKRVDQAVDLTVVSQEAGPEAVQEEESRSTVLAGR
ncbi:acyltransferase family protein [Nocardioides panacisoli]|uniref:Acyltransferase family protein n=1 Tax=Nocardioides panacisoli TaxID=627624 RepID=A0ABP7HZ30_9ACTN